MKLKEAVEKFVAGRIVVGQEVLLSFLWDDLEFRGKLEDFNFIINDSMIEFVFDQVEIKAQGSNWSEAPNFTGKVWAPVDEPVDSINENEFMFIFPDLLRENNRNRLILTF